MKKYIITMLGEKDHGKSTLIGNLLISTGSTTEARINEVRKSSKSKRFEPAHILDSFVEEREQEMTIDTTRAELVYKNAILEFIDVPGHLELIKNMMSGASNSDIAILMVSAKEEEGFRPQTKRHIYLSNMFGIKALVVAINKMDHQRYSKEIFDRTKDDVAEYLKSIGFNKPIAYIPISAYNNENLISLSKNMKWYREKTLIDTVRYFAEVYSKSGSTKNCLRIFVQDTVKLDDKKTVFGVIYNGSVKNNDTVRIEPENKIVRIENLYVKGKKVSLAREGTNVAINFDKKLDVEKGSIIYERNSRPYKKNLFGVKMFIIKDLEINPKKLMIKINNNNIPLKNIKLDRVISPISGKKVSSSKAVPANNVVYANLNLKKPYPVEKYSNYNELGRFAIYDNDTFVGVGIVE